MKRQRCSLTPEEKAYVQKFYTYPGFLKEIGDILYAAKSNPMTYDILGKTMLKALKKTGTDRKGSLVVFSNGTMRKFGTENSYGILNNEYIYYDLAANKWYPEFVGTINPSDKLKECMLKNIVYNISESLSQTYVNPVVNAMPHNLSEKLVIGMALGEIPFPFSATLAELSELPSTGYHSSDIKSLILQAMNHFIILNKEALASGNEECLQNTLFQVLRKYLMFQKMEGAE